MMPQSRPTIPITLWPGDWCLNCKDPDHGDLEICGILTLRHVESGGIDYLPCGCEDNLVLGKAGEYLIAVTKLQHE